MYFQIHLSCPAQIKQCKYFYGPVNSSVHHLLVMHFYKQVKPVFNMVKVALCLPAWKTAVKPFGPIHDVLPGPLNQDFLQWGREVVIQIQEPAYQGYRVPPSVETECCLWASTRHAINLPIATNMVLSLDMISGKIRLYFDSATIQIHTDSEPVLIRSHPQHILKPLFFDAFFLFGLCFWIHFQTATWLLLTMWRKDNALATFLNDGPRKHTDTTMASVFWWRSVSFVAHTENGYPQAIGFSLS